MHRQQISTSGTIRACSSESSDTTILALDGTSIHFEGSLEDRRRLAQFLAEAVGLSVVDTSKPLPRQVSRN
jgi:hypothetical protein